MGVHDTYSGEDELIAYLRLMERGPPKTAHEGMDICLSTLWSDNDISNLSYTLLPLENLLTDGTSTASATRKRPYATSGPLRPSRSALVSATELVGANS